MCNDVVLRLREVVGSWGGRRPLPTEHWPRVYKMRRTPPRRISASGEFNVSGGRNP